MDPGNGRYRAGLASRAEGPSPVRKFDVSPKVKTPEQFRPDDGPRHHRRRR
jgi:hypothetical protein